MTMQVQTYSLTTDHRTTPATLTAYLQTPTPGSTVQQFAPLLIIPGGSMTHIPVEETEKTALAFASRGFQVFILRYSFVSDQTPLYPAPLYDLAQAVAMINTHRATWHLNDYLHLLGFSAGGQVMALFNDYLDAPWLAQGAGVTTAELAFTDLILGYPVIDLDAGFPTDAPTLAQWTASPAQYNASQHVTATNRPTFLWATLDDPIVPVQNTINYFLAQQAAGISQEIHLFEHGPHGMDLANALVAHHPAGNQPHVAHWVDLAVEWFQSDHHQF